MRRFLDRVFNATLRADSDAKPDAALTRLLHRTIRKVTEDIEGMRFNTAISAMMVLSNELLKLDKVPTEALEVLAKLLHPFAPHLGEEVWEMLGHRPSIQHEPWPAHDPALCEEDQVEVPIQINGKVRGRITLPKDATEDQALAAARHTLASQQNHLGPRKNPKPHPLGDTLHPSKPLKSCDYSGKDRNDWRSIPQPAARERFGRVGAPPFGETGSLRISSQLSRSRHSEIQSR